jgi:23S rRNA pseudouridine2604 synthase
MTTPASSAAPDAIRLNKRLADLGFCSRREADAWIERGWVTVNGKTAGMGLKVSPHDTVSVDKKASAAQEQLATILLHKPIGVVSGQAEHGYQNAASLVSARNLWLPPDVRPAQARRFHPQILRGLAPSGRLDIDSTGLLVLTQDGRIAKNIIGEDSNISKEYLVRVAWQELERDIAPRFPAEKLALLRHGLSLDGQALKPAQVDWQNGEQLRFVLTEGKKRQIRRMCEAVGLHVVGLKRIRIGRIMLGNLPLGAWRFLLPHEQF